METCSSDVIRENMGNYAFLTDYRFVRQDAKKGTALHDGVGSSMVFPSNSRASEDANRQFSQHLNTQIVRFCLFNTFVFSFFVFAGRPNAPLFFVNFVAGLATKCSVKGNFLSRKGGFNWTINDGTHILMTRLSINMEFHK